MLTKSVQSILYLLAIAAMEAAPLLSKEIVVKSPDGNVQMRVLVFDDARLGYEATFMGKPVVEKSLLGITVDGLDLGQGVELDNSERYEIDETYAWRGVHARAMNRCNGAKISVRRMGAKTAYTLDVRVFDDGVAFSYVVPGTGRRVVSGEMTKFILPAGSTIWHHDFYMHYEGIHHKSEVARVQAGEWIAPPLTFRLPEDLGYGAITEAALVHYSGLGLQADGARGFQVRLGHEQPVSYPFELRYKKDDIERLKIPAAIEDTIRTPWRVVLIGTDLNTLVNSDIIHNLASPPDKKLFPQGFDTEWLKPGRAVWGFLCNGGRTLEEMKEMSRLAGELGFEYHVVEGHWQRWPQSEQKELVSYSAAHNVKIILWKDSRALRDPERRREFFQLCNELGAAGAKIDFFDHEAKETIDLYQSFLQEAAEHRLLLDFHGANKPTGEARTWPNELTREGIRGYEGRGPWARHNATLPFTRMLAGHADYTPLHFGDRRCETSESHQIASAIIFTSPLLIFADHPRELLKHKAVDLIKRIPSVWDESIALPASAIGEVAAFARRKGEQWFVAVMNGETARHIKIDLTFLPEGDHSATFVRDEKGESAMVSLVRKRETFGPKPGVIIEQTTANNKDALVVELVAGGGFVALITK